jgi:acid ceramidase
LHRNFFFTRKKEKKKKRKKKKVKKKMKIICFALIACIACGAANALDQTRGGSNAPPLDEFVIDLSLPPQQRWVEVTSKFNATINNIMTLVEGAIPKLIRNELLSALNTIGNDLEGYLGEYGLEIEGVAATAGIDNGLVTLMNLMYELSAACTSIVAQAADGTTLHGRNLDFGFGHLFTQDLQLDALTVDFRLANETVYGGVTYAGYVGLLTGYARGRFGVSVDETMPDDIWQVLLNVVDALLEKKAMCISFMIRDALLHNETYAQAMRTFEWTPLVADVFLIVSGPSVGDGSVVTRMRNAPRNVWHMQPNGNWADGSQYLIETNYFHWEPAPADDNRRAAADEQMQKMTQAGLSFDGLWTVLSTEPVLNRLTTYTSLMHVATGQFANYRRHCGDDCPF